jgi:hypothetical protein
LKDQAIPVKATFILAAFELRAWAMDWIAAEGEYSRDV